MSDFEAILKAYEAAGGNPESLKSPTVGSLVISGNQVLGLNAIPGLDVGAESVPDGVRVSVRVEPAVSIDMPVHLCFGVVPEEGVQGILVDYEIGAGASVEFLAHCTFPNALRVQHIMQGTVHVGQGATMRYSEVHYHGESGGIEVLPTLQIRVDEGGRYFSSFSQTKGRAGRIDLDYAVDVGPEGLAELTANASGYGEDQITVRETIRLNGDGARGLARSRVAVRDRARSEVFATTEGNAPFARGHVDCVEIVRGQALANAVPVVRVTDDRAQVTHEAAIGTVGKKELETVMARGVDEEEAVDIIVRGMLG
ncbi:MAG: SufD family Fe-S cluster assembly protein [Anaerolineae bacterium]|nr:SufD family Fe-S cluster assembly protein [Anaerolineae bacterium]